MDGVPAGRAEGAAPSDDDASVWRSAATHFAAWRDGDPTTFDALVREMTPVLWHVVRASGTTEDQARDVLQNVWLALARNPGSVRDAGAVGKWLVVSARRESWRVVAKDRRAMPVDPDEMPEGAPPAMGPSDGGPAPSAEDVALDRFDDQVLWEHVDRLSERCQRLLRVAAFLDRPNYKGLADELGLAVGSVGVIRRRCLDSLRASLVEAGRTR